MRCCVCHLHHEQAMKAPYRVRQFFAKSTQEGTTLQGWCIWWRCQCSSKQISQETGVPKICTTPRFPFILREMQPEFNMNRPLESRLRIDYSTNRHHSQLRSTDYPWLLLRVHSLVRKNGLDPGIMRKLWSNHACTQTKEEGTSWGQLLSQRYWSHAQRNSSEELSRERRQSYDCITRLWSSTICSRLGASERRSLDMTHRSTLGTFLFLWPSRELPYKNYRGKSIVNFEARDRSEEAEDSGKQEVRSNTQGYDMAVTFLLAMKSSTQIFSTRASMAAKITVVCDGRLHFSISALHLPFLPLNYDYVTCAPFFLMWLTELNFFF